MLEIVDIRMAFVSWVSDVLVLGDFREGRWSLEDQVWMLTPLYFSNFWVMLLP